MTSCHTLFEQTNTFRDALRRLGFSAQSYDLPGTPADHGADLLEAIRARHSVEPSALDRIGRGDWVFAFFPCTYFSMGGLTNWTLTGKVKRNGAGKPIPSEYIEERRRNRALYLVRFKQLLAIGEREGWQLVVENPASSLAKSGLEPLPPCQFVIRDRSRWGDIYKKPTAFWFVNVEAPKVMPYPDFDAIRNSRLLRDKIRSETRIRKSAEYKSPGGIANHFAERIIGKIDHFKRWDGTTNKGCPRVIAKTDDDFLANLRAKVAACDPKTRRMLVRSYIAPRFADTFCAWITGAGMAHG